MMRHQNGQTKSLFSANCQYNKYSLRTNQVRHIDFCDLNHAHFCCYTNRVKQMAGRGEPDCFVK